MSGQRGPAFPEGSAKGNRANSRKQMNKAIYLNNFVNLKCTLYLGEGVASRCLSDTAAGKPL